MSAAERLIPLEHGRERQGAAQGAVWGALLLIAACAATRIWLIPAHVSANPNEGWNAYQAAAALGAGRLYPPPGGLTGDNYPPLSFYLVGWAGRVVGDPIVAGRLVALAAVLAVAAGIFRGVARFAGRAPSAASLGALVFLGFAATQYRGYLAMDDPQWLAHALMTAGLVVILPDTPEARPGTGRTAIAALLMVAGGMVKHNLVAFPLATTLWLGMHHRRALAVWLATAVAALGACAAICLAAYGPVMFVDLLQADRRYSALRMAKAALPLLAVVPLLALTACLLRRRRADTRLDLLLLAVAIAVPLGVLQRSGEGVNVNAHFEALIALCITGAVALPRPGGGAKAWAKRPLVWLLAPFLVLVPLTARAAYAEAAGHASAQAAWTQMQRRIRATPGPVACETLALCYWAGEGFELDVFLYGQHVLRHGDASALEHALDMHRFAAVQLDAPHPARLGDVANPVPGIVARRSAPVFESADGRRLLVPVS